MLGKALKDKASFCMALLLIGKGKPRTRKVDKSQLGKLRRRKAILQYSVKQKCMTTKSKHELTLYGPLNK